MNIPRLAAYLFAGTSWTAVAQAPAPLPPMPEPLTQYRSAFAGYRSYIDAEPMPWRRANDAAAAIGGPMGQMAKDAMPAAVVKPGAVTNVPAPSKAGPGAVGTSR